MNYELAWKELYSLVEKKIGYCNEILDGGLTDEGKEHMKVLINELKSVLAIMKTYETIK